MSVLKLTIAYDGSTFWGSQKQANVRTVQSELEGSLSRLQGTTVRTDFAGRTDRGVHATGQVVSCADLRPELTVVRLSRAIRAHLPDDLGIASVERLDGPFHARFDAVWREYRYRIWSGREQPLIGRQVWERRAHLDLEAMNAGAARLVGTHDLATFTGGGDGVPWSVRSKTERGTTRSIHVSSVRGIDPWWGVVSDAGVGVEIRIVADGFLPQLVRNIVGALVDVGSGTQPPKWITELLDAADRRYGPVTAPPNGLILWRVGYGDDVPESVPDGTRITGRSNARTAHG